MFVDSEIADLFSKHIDVVSIAIVVRDKYFYVELTDTYCEEDVSNFTYDCVLPYLNASYKPLVEYGCVHTRASTKECQRLLLSWLTLFKSQRNVIVTDGCMFDYYALKQLLGSHWQRYGFKLMHVDQAYFDKFGVHNALQDAMHLQNKRLSEIEEGSRF